MQLTFEMTDAERILAPLRNFPEKVEKAVTSAFNRTGKTLASKLATGIKGQSYLKSKAIREAVQKPVITSDSVTVAVASKRRPADFFKVSPRRQTARKGMNSRNWPEPLWSSGPSSALRPAERKAGYSKAFVTKSKRMFQREGKNLKRVPGVSVQYFSVFAQVAQPSLEAAADTFEKRLRHEVLRQLGVR